MGPQPAERGPGWASGAFDAAVFSPEGGEIPPKYRELIALAVSIATPCAPCVETHSRKATDAGASDAELAEAAWVATAIRAGGGFTRGRLTFALSGAHEH